MESNPASLKSKKMQSIEIKEKNGGVVGFYGPDKNGNFKIVADKMYSVLSRDQAKEFVKKINQIIG